MRTSQEPPRDPFEDFPTHNREVERYQEAVRAAAGGAGAGAKLWEEELRRLAENRRNRQERAIQYYMLQSNASFAIEMLRLAFFWPE